MWAVKLCELNMLVDHSARRTKAEAITAFVDSQRVDGDEAAPRQTIWARYRLRLGAVVVRAKVVEESSEEKTDTEPRADRADGGPVPLSRSAGRVE